MPCSPMAVALALTSSLTQAFTCYVGQWQKLGQQQNGAASHSRTDFNFAFHRCFLANVNGSRKRHVDHVLDFQWNQ